MVKKIAPFIFMSLMWIGCVGDNASPQVENSLSEQPRQHIAHLVPAISVKYPGWVYLVDSLVDRKTNERLFVTATAPHAIHQINMAGQVVATNNDSKYANSMALSPDGRFLIRGTSEGTVDVLDIPTLKEQATLQVTQYSIYAVAVSADSKRIAACGADGTIQIWDLATRQKLQTLGKKGPNRMSALAFSADGARLASLRRDGQCSVWDLHSGRRERIAPHLGGEHGELRFSQDGRLLTIASGGTVIHLWDLDQAKPTKVLVPDSIIGLPRINGLGFPPDQGRPMNAPLTDYAFGLTVLTPDLNLAATALENGNVALWNVRLRLVLVILPAGHGVELMGGGVQSLAFSPDAQFLATGNRDGHAELWRISDTETQLPKAAAGGIPTQIARAE